MNSALCIGIASKPDVYEVVALGGGRETVAMKFPATMLGVEAIRGFLCSCGGHLRLAVAGVAAVSLGLALGDAPGRQTFIVASNARIADQAGALARYADHTL